MSSFADPEAKVRMTPRTRFLAGSLGKSLHAALAVALAREGVVDLDAPIERWIGREPWFDRLPNARALTLRHLIQHQSGLVDHLFTLEFVLRELRLRLFEHEDALLPPEELIEAAFDRQPQFAPGDGFAYGDTNYVLAGIVLHHATDRSSFDQIDERFLHPRALGGILAARSPRIPQLAFGYQVPVNPFLLPPKMEANELPAPDARVDRAGFAGTPHDWVRWVKALLESPDLAPIADEMTRHTVDCGDGRRYGLGLFRTETPLGPAWGHGGYFPGYRSALIYFPAARIAVAAEANRDVGVDLDALLLEIAERVKRARDAEPAASDRGADARAG